MNIRDLSAGDRRAILLGGAVLLPAILWIWAVRPYRAALDELRDKVAVERESLARERAAIAAARRNPELQHRADSAMQAATPRLFAGRDDVMASADLASYLGEIARTRHVWLQDASTRPAAIIGGGVRALRVEVRAESDLQGVLSFLQALETGTKLVRVDRIDISRQPNRSDDSSVETLAVSATIIGYAIPSEAGAAQATRAAAKGSSP